MESTAIAGGGGGPAPFLLKTYDMVDDSSTNEIVSWSPTNNSFVVWDSPQFAAKLLPTYFKHNNFSSFIRQLNTYGFRKIDPERWEFANEEFIKGQKHLLKNIHRRKPIHSHSHPPGSAMPDPERIALEEEIDRLTREKQVLHADLWRFRQQQGGTKIQLEDLERRLLDIERRQAKMLNFLQRAVQNPKFVENLIKMASDDLAIHKKRRLPGSGPSLEVSTENSGSGLNECSNFCDRLKLGLSSAAVSDSGNLGTASTQSSNEEEGNSLLFPRKSDLFGGTDDDGDELISCHLKLTLASSSMQVDRSPNSTSTSALAIEEVDTGKEEDNERVAGKNSSNAGASNDDVAKKSQEVTLAANQGPLAPVGRVNDVFWEQFLTERPGSSDTEEASSSLRVNPSEEQQEERKPGSDDGMWRNRKDLEQLTL